MTLGRPATCRFNRTTGRCSASSSRSSSGSRLLASTKPSTVDPSRSAWAFWNCWRSEGPARYGNSSGSCPAPSGRMWSVPCVTPAIRRARRLRTSGSSSPSRSSARSPGRAPFGTLPGGVPARVNAAVADNTHVGRGLSGCSPGPACTPSARHRAAEVVEGRHNRLVPASPHAPSPVDLAARLRDRRHRALLPARAPGDKANRAPDWTALTPDDFLAALKTACRAESVPSAAVRETERRLAGGVLQARELHLVLLTVGRSDEWAAVRQAALVALT